MPIWTLPGTSVTRTYDRRKVGNSDDNSLRGDAGFRNLLEGLDGNDTLTGSGSNDILVGVGTRNAYGGNDVDRLSGGVGEDWFVVGDAYGNYYNNTSGYAIIADWNASPDTVVIDGTRSRSDGGIGLFSKNYHNLVGGSPTIPDLEITTTGGTQAILVDDGDKLNSFQADINSWVSTGSNLNASGNNNGFFWLV